MVWRGRKQYGNGSRVRCDARRDRCREDRVVAAIGCLAISIRKKTMMYLKIGCQIAMMIQGHENERQPSWLEIPTASCVLPLARHVHARSDAFVTCKAWNLHGGESSKLEMSGYISTTTLFS
jgi:hypothetical protein